MRLLEFGRDEGGANPLQTGRPDPADGAAVQKSPAATLEAPRPLAKPARNTRKARVFPIKPGNGQRKPIDLEQLQQPYSIQIEQLQVTRLLFLASLRYVERPSFDSLMKIQKLNRHLSILELELRWLIVRSLEI